MDKKKYELVVRFVQNFCDKHLKNKVSIKNKLNSTFSDLGLNSIELVELLILAEKKFNILIEGTDLPKEDSIKLYIALIYSKAEKNHG